MRKSSLLYVTALLVVLLASTFVLAPIHAFAQTSGSSTEIVIPAINPYEIIVLIFLIGGSVAHVVYVWWNTPDSINVPKHSYAALGTIIIVSVVTAFGAFQAYSIPTTGSAIGTAIVAFLTGFGGQAVASILFSGFWKKPEETGVATTTPNTSTNTGTGQKV